MNYIDGKNWQVKRVTPEEWNAVLDWARSEQWDLGEQDQLHFFNADPNGFFIGYHNGQPVASVSVVNHSSEYAHIGHYLVDPSRRGEGWGLKTWLAGLEHAGNRTLGGDGMLIQEANYKKSGLISYYLTRRLTGLVQHSFEPAVEILPITDEDLAGVIEYDQHCLGVHRPAFLKDWFLSPNRRGFLSRGPHGLNGLVGIRPSTDGFRLGPLYSQTANVTEALLITALSSVPVGSRVTLDTPETSGDLLDLTYRLGFKTLFPTVRMYRGPAPEGEQSQVKAISTLELG